MTNRPASYVRMNFGERVKAWEELQLVCKKEGDFAVYETGYDDRRIAALVASKHGFACTEAGISGIRREMIGNINPSKIGMPVTELMAGLEKRIARLEAEVFAAVPAAQDSLL